MDAERRNDDEQTARWNGRAGHAWVDLQPVLDGMFRPIEDLLVEAVSAEGVEHVLDVGCGTGGTTLAVARRLGPAGTCVGVDISEPLIDTARARAEREGAPASFVRGDAQEHSFEPGTFDAVISRFGVMFFEDPVRAFANLRSAARDDAALRLIVWRDPAENPYMTTAQRAAAPLLPDLPVRRPDEPGQFAFADPDKVRRILTESGWADIDIRPVDIVCTLPEKELVRYFTRLGPLGMALPEVDEETRARVVETVRAAFEPFVHGAEVRFTAACWTVGARASAAKVS
ncbi:MULTISPECIES: class I SAM-dependent methyltransferase [Streptomyces]|uniref:Methyltransferase domain-containing protein n=1 Tax=Streptomyces koelreuteriae TaxID=2838015 RepID=A0ABX8G2W4_9ACTN|nr:MULTISPECIES: class I SAM-dependent methyltransferase [Streptomyces]QWB27480.1 methyltransferase domain-containing protein [Streptomyces koelreuteriae]UUA10569.1 class I SAM-dependent methyltransferase [Streptomyces koelreuteriae]UUA18176.1 class I SAM-dependent methyltransferase [Streptomyces sp. CRCS-T-1]